MAKEVKLQSGKVLEISMAPFSEAKALYQAVLDEAKALKLDMNQEIDGNFWKDIFCAGLSSKKIELALEACLKRSTYNGVRIVKVDEVFESEEARGDYFEVCFEVARENILPFTKNLFAKYGHILGQLKTAQQ